MKMFSRDGLGCRNERFRVQKQIFINTAYFYFVMGLLNHLFGNKKSIAKELVMDDNKRMNLWRKHISNYYKREALCKHFSFGNIDNALKYFETTKKVLDQIESLISSELINIKEEDKDDKEILADLESLRSDAEIDDLLGILVEEKQKQTALLSLFKEIHDTLLVELYMIRLIRKKPFNVKEILLKLFTLINNREFMLYKVFNKEYFSNENKESHAKIVQFARAIILGQELKEEIETDEEKFAKDMLRLMAPGESKKGYRKLGENIFSLLDNAAEVPLKGEGILIGIKKMERLMKDDEFIYKLIKKLKPRFDDTKIRAAIIAFRKAYDFGHFE